MGRWQPGAKGRLGAAAMELFAEQGYEQTTVAEIAGRAGLAERTFFRHFSDKREVLFFGGDALRDLVVANVADAPAGQGPLDVVVGAFEAVAGVVFVDIRAHSRRRQAIIDSHPDLQERELIKLANLSAAIADALRQRGVADPAATLAAEAGVAVFKLAFERWVGDGDDADDVDLASVLRASLADLRSVTGA